MIADFQPEFSQGNKGICTLHMTDILSEIKVAVKYCRDFGQADGQTEALITNQLPTGIIWPAVPLPLA